MWGVYETEFEVHVVPTDKDGYAVEPHILDLFCFCEPYCKQIGEDGRLIIEHNTEN